jgi:antitoxin (DNA-binding transcriptional repressor) of toxin-antitoxin stability system
MFMTMIVININEAKAKFSEYLEAAANGERVVICKRNRPVAEMHAVAQARTEPRPVGPGRHRFSVSDAFFDPMPDDFLDAFEAGAIYPETKPHEGRVAESPAPPYGRSSKRKRR